jgi:signal transduction histidine kinase
MSDVLKLAAIRSQIETAGIYDDKKKIDVTAYVNRKSNLSGDYITAVYYLKDLLKWAQNGFNFETKDFTDEEAREFLGSTTTYTHLKNNVYSGGMNSYLNSQIEGNSVVFSVASNTIVSGGQHTYLLPRYQTVDGRNVEDIVSNWDEYNALCSNVTDAAKNLLTNYQLYGKSLEYYDYLNTNIRYYITRTIDGKSEIYTNISELSGETTGKDIKKIFSDYGKYIYYCPYELEYETNTLIKENMLRSVIKNFNYAYPDQMKLYIAVDTSYPANDSFTDGKKTFGSFMPYKGQLYVLCAISLIMYFVLMFIYIMDISKSSRLSQDADGENAVRSTAPTFGSSLFTEAFALIGILIMAFPAVVYWLLSMAGLSFDGGAHKYIPYVFAAAFFIVSIGFLFGVYGIIQRVYDKTIFEKSFIRALALGTKKLIVNTTDNANVIIRTWIPYVFFVAMNLLLYRLGIPGIIIAVILDFIVGIFVYRQNKDRDRIIHVIGNIENGDVKAKVDVNELHGDNINLAMAVNSIGEGIDRAVNTSMKDEKLKADLITNVSHDIKTPLTSIINYVDLIKREDIDNEKVNEYVDILDRKSQKLKQLTEDLVEASKISSGNISIQISKINFVELVNQTIGEFYEKLEKNDLQVIFKPQMQNMQIYADARHLWRVIENLLNNVCKYALAGTRVYIDMQERKEIDKMVVFSIKNISAKELNVDADELTERFIRGDESRATEGSGLGLSIAKNLTLAQNGTFDIRLDGDLFKVIIKFRAVD